MKVAVALKLALAGRYELHPVGAQDLLQEIPARSVVRVDQSHLHHSVLVFDDHGLASGSDPERVRYLRKIQAEHVAIYEAIRTQNTTAARKAARRHLSNSLGRYQEISARASRRAEVARLAQAE